MQLSFECDSGLATGAALGLIVLQADETIECEFRSVFDQVGEVLYHARIPSAPEVTAETLRQMEAQLTGTAALLPGHRKLDVVGYGCTSASTIIGSEAVERAVQKVHSGALVTNPARAVLAALSALKVSKIGVVTPYVPEVADAVVGLLSANGFNPVQVGSFGQSEETVVARITPGSVQTAICALGKDPGVEAVFASCTNLRTFPVLAECERLLGKPVVSSNQTLAWHMLKLAGLETRDRGPGRLFGC